MSEDQDQSNLCCSQSKRYLCVLVYRLLNFRAAEIQAIAELVGLTSDQFQLHPPGGNTLSPFWYVTLPSEEAARQLVQRCLLVKVRGLVLCNNELQ